MNKLNDRELNMVKRILKTNHAGEYGAIRIYKAQIWIAKKRFPDMVPPLQQMLEDEIEHCQIFKDAMPARKTRPCYISHRWGDAGFLLGFATALMGRQAIWACTAAVEGVVHRHLEAQLYFLKSRDVELFELIAAIQAEEMAHLSQAETNLTSDGFVVRILGRWIELITEAMIWLATLGDSSKMEKRLAEIANG